ncbi:MAG: DUF302 domain-containing protein [Hyphomicrobiaceae bacterium]
MRIWIMPLLLLAVACGSSVATGADNGQGYRTKTANANFEATWFDLQNAIVDRGLVIDYTGHVSKMLDRTSQATGAGSPYIDGRYVLFCSAKLSQAAMQADPNNLAVCPYIVFAYELKAKPGVTVVGYRRPLASEKAASASALSAIEKLLNDLITEATQ